MQYGCCLSAWTRGEATGQDVQVRLAGLLRQIDTVFDAGFSFVELTVSSLMALTEQEYDVVRTALSFAPLPIFACNSLIPETLPIVGPQADTHALQAYMARVVDRADGLGVQRLVFGSGRARSAPAGFSRDQADAQIARFLEICQQETEGSDVMMVIEPLRSAESDILNTVVETATWVERLGLSRVRLLADTYHMYAQREPLAVLNQTAHLLSHIHVANKEERRYPGFAPSDVGDMRDLLRVLKSTGYDQGVSVECHFEDFALEVPRALACLTEAEQALASES